MEKTIRRYFDGCNQADVGLMMDCFAPDAVHYFPQGAAQGTMVGAEAIAQGWASAVAKLGSAWTVDRVVIDEVKGEAVIEWTHYKTKAGTLLRGAEWYEFDEEGRIREIRAYYAAPALQAIDYVLCDFDYSARGYPMSAPVPRD